MKETKQGEGTEEEKVVGIKVRGENWHGRRPCMAEGHAIVGEGCEGV